MLYVTTRNDRDAFTLHHIMMNSRGADGGLYLPLRFPRISDDDLKKLRAQSFNQRIASVLNLFLSSNLSGWDIDFSVGRYPVRLRDLSHRIILGEFWHNLQWNYNYFENKLAELICCENTGSGSWPVIAIRMAILAGTLLERDETEYDAMDIAVAANDLSVPISAWYLKKMGFPIGNVICCCTENNQLWELVCLGQMKTDDMVPDNLERLISDCGGIAEAMRFSSCCLERSIYSASDETLKNLRQSLHVSVVSGDRVETTVPNVFRTYDYILQTESALAYCGLMDYRTKTGITRPVMVISDYSPICEAEKISAWMSLSKDAFLQMI